MRTPSWSTPEHENATVELFLVDEGGRQLDVTPNLVSAGALQLRSWQVHPIAADPVDLAGRECYLLRINYELIVDDNSSFSWFEAGFSFTPADADADAVDVVVLDALPHAVRRPQGAATYVVNRHLNLALNADGRVSDAYLPALMPTVDLFGVGGREVRWRHSGKAGSQPGSHVAWAVVTVPLGCVGLTVHVAARFDLEAKRGNDYRPVGRATQFYLRLCSPKPERCGATPDTVQIAPVSDAAVRRRAAKSRVFICYAYDDDCHVEAVRAFGTFLLDCGVDAHMDYWDVGERKDWYQWALDQFRRADFVLVVASPICRAVGDGTIEEHQHRGMQSELAVLRELASVFRATSC